MIVKARGVFKEGESENLIVKLLEGNVLKVSYTKINGENGKHTVVEKEIMLKDIFTPFNTCSVFSNLSGTEIMNPVKIRLSRDSSDLFKSVNNLDKLLCVIYFNKTIEELLVISNISVNMSCEVFDEFRLFDTIVKTYPEYEPHEKMRRERQKILSELDCNSSLAGLEAQVDYLTFIVKNLIYENLEIKKKLQQDVPNLDSFFNICGTENLLVIKPEDKLFEKIKNEKSFIREKQTAFYNAVNGG